MHVNVGGNEVVPAQYVAMELNMFKFIEGPLKELLSTTSEVSVIASRYQRIGASSWYSAVSDETLSHMTISSSSSMPFLSVQESIDDITFWCPKCGASFHGDWGSCMKHVTSRGHGNRCLFSKLDRSFPNISDKALKKDILLSLRLNDEQLPKCISSHAYLPVDAHSGWCDLQGRRRYIEDSHAILFSDADDGSDSIPMGNKYSFRLFGVFDGHEGSRAALFATRFLPHTFERYLNHDTRLIHFDMLSRSGTSLAQLPDRDFLRALIPRNISHEILAVGADVDLTAEHSVRSLHDAFILTNIEFLARSNPAEQSGTTATIAVLLGQEKYRNDDGTNIQSFTHLLVGHVGDSRAVYCCREFSAVVLTTDHTPSVEAEATRVYSKSGFIDKAKDILRVNGRLAVTRSIGDRPLRKVLSAVPDMLLIELPRGEENMSHASLDPSGDGSNSSCSRYTRARGFGNRNIIYPFLVLASDGLWDVFSNQEAVDFVCDVLLSILHSHDSRLPLEGFQTAARALALEALVRGSSDNIGVCVVDIIH